MPTIDKEIGLRLKVARKAAGYKTALAFAKKMNIPKTTYSQHENGKRSLTAEQIMFYSHILSLEPSWLLTGLGHPCPTSQDKINRKAYIEKSIIELQQANELPILKNIQISAEDNSAVVNMILFKKILVKAIKELSEKNLGIHANELVMFCIDIYNNIEFLVADEFEKERIIDLSINSMLRGNKVIFKKASSTS